MVGGYCWGLRVSKIFRSVQSSIFRRRRLQSQKHCQSQQGSTAEGIRTGLKPPPPAPPPRPPPPAQSSRCIASDGCGGFGQLGSYSRRRLDGVEIMGSLFKGLSFKTVQQFSLHILVLSSAKLRGTLLFISTEEKFLSATSQLVSKPYSGVHSP